MDLAVLIRQLQGKIRAIEGQIGELRFAVGADSLTGNGSSHTYIKSINHGLGTTPLAVIVGTDSEALNGAGRTFTSTTFTARIRHIDSTSWSGAAPFYWIAVAA